VTADDARALRDRLEETQGALREARAELEALRRRVAELEHDARTPRAGSEVDELRRQLKSQGEELEAAHAREERLLLESDARGARLIALSAELDRYRATARRAEPPVKKLEVRPKEGGAPKPPPPPPKRAPKPAAATREPSLEASEPPAADDEPAPARPAPRGPAPLPPQRPNNPRPMTPGRILVGGSAEEVRTPRGIFVERGAGERTPPAAAAGCALPVLAMLLALAVVLGLG